MKKNRLKQILAIIALVVIAGLYITTLVLALIGSEKTKSLFMASIICTVAVPVFLYIVSWIYKLVKGEADDARKKALSEEEPSDDHLS